MLERVSATFVQRWAHRARVVEAMTLLTAAGAAQKWVPMPRWSFVLGRPGQVPAAWLGRRIEDLPSEGADRVEYRTVLAVRRAARALPWKPTCLAEATAGQVLLRQAGQPGIVALGLQSGSDHRDGRWRAHAWLLGRHGALLGGQAATGFTATTVYQTVGGLDAADVVVLPGWTWTHHDGS